MFASTFKFVGNVVFPEYSGVRVMMMPLVLGDLDSVPPMLAGYCDTLAMLFALMETKHVGNVGYLTVDEKIVKRGTTHRRAGLHVDGVFEGRCGGWGGGGWGSVGNGMLTTSSHVGCRAWNQEFDGYPGNDGECDHLASQLRDAGTIFEPRGVYWVDGLCVHESMPLPVDTNRQFVRLSMPSKAPWFQGYTVNPLGVKPTGDILPPRPYMEDTCEK
jgi:hypothetical protein